MGNPTSTDPIRSGRHCCLLDACIFNGPTNSAKSTNSPQALQPNKPIHSEEKHCYTPTSFGRKPNPALHRTCAPELSSMDMFDRRGICLTLCLAACSFAGCCSLGPRNPPYFEPCGSLTPVCDTEGSIGTFWQDCRKGILPHEPCFYLPSLPKLKKPFTKAPWPRFHPLPTQPVFTPRPDDAPEGTLNYGKFGKPEVSDLSTTTPTYPSE